MHDVLISLATIIGAGIAAQWLAWRLRLPSILLLLSFGFLIGPVSGFLAPDRLFGETLIPFVSLSVALILFEGGLSLSLRHLPKVGHIIRNLVTAGALLTLLLTSLAAWMVLGMDLRLSLLLGAILVVTGPTVVLPLLRQIRPSKEIGAILRWEGIVIDPVGATLAVLVYEAILVTSPGAATSMVFAVILKTIAVGGIAGFFGALIVIFFLKRYWIPDYLESSVTLMTVLGVFVISNLLQEESGFLTVTVMGIVMANQRSVAIDHIVEFKENLQVLLLGVLFVLLSSRLRMEDFGNTDFTHSLLFLAALILIIRPISVLVSTLKSHLSWQQRLFLGWMAPRGIVAASVSAIFALRLSEEGIAGASELVPVTFIVIVGTISIYGLTSMPLARWLGVAQPDPQGFLIIGSHSWARSIAESLQSSGIRVVLADSNYQNTSSARMAGLNTYYGNVLSRKALDEINLDGIGNLIALTGNDEVNSLCCLHFTEVFGKASVFQLAFEEASEERQDPISKRLHGRLLFSNKLSFRELRSIFVSGGRIRTTRLSEEFDLDRFRSGFRGVVYPLFIIRSDGRMRPFLVDKGFDPRPGDKIICLIPKESAAVPDNTR
jgi:NhaP-type Na+/H+ or K+/H+ antiporter